ncbi:hypothetical protein LXL04_018662 [Taraxacum kok-saghyz]
MESVEEIKTLEEDVVNWRSRILYPTLIGGIVGGGIGAVSKHRKVHGLANMSATYATNLAIVTGCYCGAREIVKATRHSGPDDLLDSAIAGFSTDYKVTSLNLFSVQETKMLFLLIDNGQVTEGGRAGAIRYSIGIAIAGTGVDFVGIKLRPYLKEMYESVIGGEKKDSWMRWPEWLPIQVLDEEAQAAKRAREEQLRARIRDLTKEESEEH